MKLLDINKIHIWRSELEQTVLNKITSPTIIESLEERDQTVVETLIRKNLLTKVTGRHSTYVYPTEL